jgi:hypothetical protein
MISEALYLQIMPTDRNISNKIFVILIRIQKLFDPYSKALKKKHEIIVAVNYSINPIYVNPLPILINHNTEHRTREARNLNQFPN